MEQLYSFGEWRRIGHGSELQFFALDEEVDTWIAEGLPKKLRPYQMLTSDMVKQDRRGYAERLIRCEDLALTRCRQGSERSSFWIGSARVSPQLLESLQDPRDCSTNGLILVQQLQRRGARDIGRIAITGKIRHSGSGEVVEHREYLQAYRSLAKRIAADLVYSTLLGDGDQIVEDRQLALMTTGAAHAAQEGRVRFTRTPGKIIK